MIIHTLSIKRGVHQATQIHDCPWLLCEPNEVEGRKLLAEIMQGGNFGQLLNEECRMKNEETTFGGRRESQWGCAYEGKLMKHGLWKLKRVMRLVSSYPEEALWEPVFRVFHLGWRLFH